MTRGLRYNIVMKTLIRPKGFITSRFSNTEAYRDTAHTGIDFYNGFKSPCRALRGGWIYKVKRGSENLQDYRIIYQICETEFGPIEIAYVHCWDIYVKEGDRVLGGEIIYTEGNTGDKVFVGGRKVRPEDKPSGRGSHSHISVRPVRKVKTQRAGHYYLSDSSGERYKDKHNNYYEVVNMDNGFKGKVDFESMLTSPSLADVVNSAVKGSQWKFKERWT